MITKPLYTRDLDWTAEQFSRWEGSAVFLVIVGTALGGLLADRFGKKPVMFVGFGGLMISLLETRKLTSPPSISQQHRDEGRQRNEALICKSDPLSGVEDETFLSLDSSAESDEMIVATLILRTEKRRKAKQDQKKAYPLDPRFKGTIYTCLRVKSTKREGFPLERGRGGRGGSKIAVEALEWGVYREQ